MCGFPSPPSLPAPRCLCIRSPLPHACPVWGDAWMEGMDGLVGGGSGGRVDGGGRGQRGHGAGGHVDGRNLQSWARSPPKMLGSPVGVCPLGDCHRLGGGGRRRCSPGRLGAGFAPEIGRQRDEAGLGTGTLSPMAASSPSSAPMGPGTGFASPSVAFGGGGGEPGCQRPCGAPAAAPSHLPGRNLITN